MRKGWLVLMLIYVAISLTGYSVLADVGPPEPKAKPAPPASKPAAATVPQTQVTTYSSTVTTTYEPAGKQYLVGDKLARGFANVLTSPLEIPRNVQNVTADQGVLVGWSAGLAQGIGMMALRIIVGAYEIITFPIPFPEDYKPVIEPEFVWQAPGPKVTPQQGKSKKS